MTALAAALLAAGTVFFLGRPSAARVGGSAHRRGGGRTPRPERRAQPRRLPAAPQAPTPPTPPQTSDQPAGTPELELRELIVRKYAATAPARPRIEREIDAALERIEARRAAEARARAAQRRGLARSELRLWRGLIKSRLYAVMSGSDEAFAVSEPFPSRDADAPGPQAERALSSLLASLSQTGWRVVTQGSAWYDLTLELFARDPDAGSTGPAPGEPQARPRVVYRTGPARDDEGAK
jgi:hypothetical protein